MCAIRTTSVSVGQSIKAHGSSGSWLVEAAAEACIGVPLLDSMAADAVRPLCGVEVMSRYSATAPCVELDGSDEVDVDERLMINLGLSRE